MLKTLAFSSIGARSGGNLSGSPGAVERLDPGSGRGSPGTSVVLGCESVDSGSQ